MKFLLSIIILFIYSSSFGCLNGETKFLNNGFWVYEDFDGRVPRGHYGGISEEELPELLNELDSLYRSTDSVKYLSDYGYVLIFNRDYKKAISIYQKIDSISPSLYSTASNLGTAYELIGENDLALKWIMKSYEINQKSHHNSEWIHINILKIKTDSKLEVTSGNLINTSFGSSLEPKTDLSNSELETLHESIYYQLNERMTFISGKNQIIGNLLFDLANISLILNYKSDATRMYKMAKDYGYNSELIDTRIELANKKDAKDTYYKVVRHDEFPMFLILGLIATFIVSVVVFILYRILKKKS